MDFCSGQLKLYSSVTETTVDWLWYPYIPFGKITLIQGDPGCGKSTLMMNLIASVSNGSFSIDRKTNRKPMHVIYQCSEDGLSDTIKPRLIAAGANCSNIAFLDEEKEQFSLSDDTIRRAIAEFHTKLLVIDPVQAYLGDADIANATGMRRILRQLSLWASMYECAIVLVGHLNKKQSSKELYRSLGSIDLVAAARSVLHIERISGEDEITTLQHVKSSLAPRGRELFFTIDSKSCIEWIEHESIPTDDQEIYGEITVKRSKQMQAAEILHEMLADGPIKATQIMDLFKNEKISERTVMMTKKALGINSVKKDGVWFWQLPDRNI